MSWVLVISSAYCYFAVRQPLPPITANVTVVKAANNQTVALPWPNKGQAAIGDLEQGVLAKSTDNEVASPTASLAKIITALAVLSKHPIAQGQQGPDIILDSSDVDLFNYYDKIGGSKVAVSNGEHLTERQALQAMLLPSSNNMADSLAIWAFGSMPNYTAYANIMLKGWGLNKTVAADASGISAKTVSVPSELITIGQKVFKNPTLAEIVRTKQTDIPVAGIISNTNILLGDNGVIGIKTGNTDEAGGCMLFAASKKIDSSHLVTIIGAVQGAENLKNAFGTSTNLINTSAANYGNIVVSHAGDKIGKLTTKWGQTTDIITKNDLTTFGWKESKHITKATIKTGDTPINAGYDVGRLIVGNDSTPIVTRTNLKKASIFWRLLH